MEGMMAKLRAGNAYDVMFPTAEYVQRLIQQEQLVRIPPDKLNNLDDIYSYFDAVREAVPHLADTELRRGLE
jgi:spermidine/putrescine transport system substrate-binding protein